jgi:hypothetical protein
MVGIPRVIAFLDDADIIIDVAKNDPIDVSTVKQSCIQAIRDGQNDW